jgi:hypothetical protein
MKIIIILLSFVTIVSAQDDQSVINNQNLIVDVEQFCTGPTVNIKGMSYVVTDSGFCNALSEIRNENNRVDTNFVKDISHTLLQLEDFNKPPIICPVSIRDLQFGDNIDKDKWKVKFYASHSFTTYFNTDLKIRSTRHNVDIENYEWRERGSRNFFLPSTWRKKGNNPFQVLDEPSNTFTLSIEKNGHEFFLSAFHPKFLQQEGQVKHVTGTIDGVTVDEYQQLDQTPSDYSLQNGQMNLLRNQNTHREMMFEVGYGHRFKLLEGKAGSIVYVPSLALGVTTGHNLTVMVRDGQRWEFEESDDKYRIQGVGGSVTNRIEFNTAKEKFGIFYENRFSYYKQKHGYSDGTQEYDLKLMGNSVGVKFMIYNPKNKRRINHQ